MLSRRIVLQAGAAAALTASFVPARAAGKVTMLYSPIPPVGAAFVAQDQGLFKKHNVDIDLTFMSNGAAIGAALTGANAQIGTITPTVLLQATDAGLDLVAIAGGDVYPVTTKSGIVVKADGGINAMADLTGKKLAVSGLGGSIDLLLRKQLRNQKIANVNIVEIGIAGMADALKAGQVDAAILIDPFYARTMNAGGYKSIGDVNVAPLGTTAFVYVSSRAWAEQNAQTVQDFRAALDDAAAFVKDKANEAAVQQTMSTYTKLPVEVLRTIALPNLQPRLTPDALTYWVTLMREQGMLQSAPDPAKLVLR